MRSAIPASGGAHTLGRRAWHRSRRGLLAGAAVAATVAATLVASTVAAHAATLFSDDFQDGNATGWSGSGGSWSVVMEAGGSSLVYRQSSTGSDAKRQAGSVWADQTVQARVRPIAFNSGSGRFAGLLGRVQNNTNYYYLALTSGNEVVLGKRVSGGYTSLASAAATVSTGSWYTLRLEAFGGQLRGYLNGQQVVSASDGTFGSGRVGLATLYASASFDDVLVTDEPGEGEPPSSPPPSTPPSSSPPPSSPPPPPPGDGPVGWASMAGGTSGGAGGRTVTVTDGATLADLMEEDEPLIIQVQGMISMPDEMNDAHSDKTIVGVGANSGFSGGGLNISSGYHNIIVRNLVFTGWTSDAIEVEGQAHHIWVDHNRFTGAGGGADGSVDVKHGSDYVTVSWNHTTHDKNMLLGHDDDNTSDRGHLRVTYHHNWFDGSAERNPRVRYGNPVHVFNNYYDNNEVYGVASTVEAGVLVEGNYFENVPRPIAVGYAESPPGNVVQRNNVFVGSGPVESTGTGVDPIPYGYELDSASDVPVIVVAGAGTGKIG